MRWTMVPVGRILYLTFSAFSRVSLLRPLSGSGVTPRRWGGTRGPAWVADQGWKCTSHLCFWGERGRKNFFVVFGLFFF